MTLLDFEPCNKERRRAVRLHTRVPFEPFERWLYHHYGTDPIILEQPSNPQLYGKLWTDARIAEWCDVNRGVVARWRVNGLTIFAADHAAVTAGASTPNEIWPGWSELPLTYIKEHTS